MTKNSPRRTIPGWRWEFGQAPPIPFNAPDANNFAAVQTWLPAAVPGNVQLDLLAHRLIPDPVDHAQLTQVAWVDGVDWWYRTQISADLAPGQRAFVRFHGLDYLSAIFVNGQERVRREGMFSRQTVEITADLRAGGCTLAVRLWGNNALPRRKLSAPEKLWSRLAGLVYRNWAGVYPDRSATLKAQFSFGWDFVPAVRPIGIWDTVELLITGPVLIEDCRVAVDLAGRGRAVLTLNAPSAGPILPELALTGPAGRFEKPEIQLSTPTADPSTLELAFTVPNPQCWQAWDLGVPNLYTLTAAIPGSDSVTTRFGIRSAEWRNWQFSLNGQAEFIRGVNWAPADIFPGRVRPADYAELLALAKAGGANLVRVWGGGLREKQAFYDWCDELGLLVWQEFPFACMFLGAFPRDEAYLALARQECAEMVRQLHNHPSVVTWCGGNEFSLSRNRPLIETIRAVLEQTDLERRPFLPASPSPGEAHQWDVWHGEAPFSVYRREQARFLSEFGVQALPAQATLEAVLPQPAQNWEARCGDTPKLRRYLTPFLAQPLDLPAQIAASQEAQACGLQIAVEHMRRRKKITGGAIIWQFNEPWPAISWALVDYFRRPKRAYHALSRWFQPVLISLDFEPGLPRRAGDLFEATVWGVNDYPQAKSGRVTVTLNGEPVFEALATLAPQSAAVLGQISLRPGNAPAEAAALWQAEDGPPVANRYNLAWADPTPIKPGAAFRRRVADWVLR